MEQNALVHEESAALQQIEASELPFVEFESVADEDWISATDAAELFEVSVRQLRALATAGRLQRRVLEGQVQYRIPDEDIDLEDDGSSTLVDLDESTARADLAAVKEGTQPGTQAETTGAVRRDAVAERSVHEEKTVVISEEDIEFLNNELVQSELLNTNRDLMRLVEGVLSRWTEAHSDRSRSNEELKKALNKSLELQQCLTHWQHHASQLRRVIDEQQFITTRALDLAEEAVASRWTPRKRQAVLKARLISLRDKAES